MPKPIPTTSGNNSEVIEKVLNEFDEKSNTSFANGGFLTTDLDDEFHVDVELQKSFLRTTLQKVYDTVRKEAIEGRDAMWLEFLKNAHPQVLVQLQGEIALRARLKEKIK